MMKLQTTIEINDGLVVQQFHTASTGTDSMPKPLAPCSTKWANC